MTQKEKIDSLNARTNFQKTVKEVLLDMVTEETESEFPTNEKGETVYINEDDIDGNLKKDLVAYAEYHSIDVPEPQNKPDYVEAIQEYLNK